MPWQAMWKVAKIEKLLRSFSWWCCNDSKKKSLLQISEGIS
jgi:hypothetical protein